MTLAAGQGVRDRSSLPLSPSLAFLDPIVSTCLQWSPSCRPTAAALHHSVSAHTQERESPLSSETVASGATSPLAASLPLALTTTELLSSALPRVSMPQLHRGFVEPGPGQVTGDSTSSKCNGDHCSEPVLPTSKSTNGNGCDAGQDLLAAARSSDASQQRGNPKYGRCEIEGCGNYKLRKHILTCWGHRDRLLPSEMLIARTLQSQNLLQDVFPCDLVSCLALADRCRSLYGGLLPFAVVSALKVPSASLTFVTELEKTSRQDATNFVAALAAAYSPQRLSVISSACDCMSSSRIGTAVSSESLKLQQVTYANTHFCYTL